ncbi:hypothetical protein K1T71_013455 [Dendrolimus kikuchii]|uniref:Uncharacterized protein n=1 Tax=Dendrolimus kikuchii TaxID=765133 RepID=A0ACC1CGP6_9NEOP|nr:hypothetical protein K1T71_013455 [Dendrolimus kikuchii]
MKTVSSLKSNKSDSPKTPGGISKSLLTPCRRLGLSRNWKRQGPSPFISPLAGNGEVSSSKEENVEIRKRKKRDFKEIAVSSDCLLSSNLTTTDGCQTPSRDVEIPCKKSKTLTTIINKSQEDLCIESDVGDSVNKETDNPILMESDEVKNTDQVSTPVRSKSKSKKTLVKSSSMVRKHNISNDLSSEDFNETELKENLSERKHKEETIKTQLKAPNDLAKECIVVIQKKIFKKDLEKPLETCSDKVNTILKEDKPNSQVLFDSDSDNEPLIRKNKHKSKPTSDNDDFIPTTIITKTNSKTTKKPKIIPKMPATQTVNPNTAKFDEKIEETQSQTSLDEDDDFEVDCKRTILIRKTYDKVKKPIKAKSTGSISQKDIDELKARIEVKKKTLLTKATMEDTKELRDLIKKWQKGCQDALMQLMDLMNSKMSDKKNMGYSEMLEMLKIPPQLVGYDEENDCFNTPDDTNIILSNI